MKPRRRRLLRALLILTALAAVAAPIVYVAGRPALDEWARGRARAELAALMGRPVSIGAVHIDPLAFTFEAHDLVVGERPPGTGKVLEVPAVYGSLKPGALLYRRLEFSSLRVDSPRVSISRQGDRWEGPFPIPPPKPKHPLLERPSPNLKLILRVFQVSGGLITFEEKTLPLEGRAEGLNVEWTGESSGDGKGTLDAAMLRAGSGDSIEAGTIHAEGRLEGETLHALARVALGKNTLRADGSVNLPGSSKRELSGEASAALHIEEMGEASLLKRIAKVDVPLAGALDANGRIRFSGARWNAQGTLTGQGLVLDDLAVHTLAADVRADPRAIELTRFELGLLGGRLTGSGRVEPRAGGALRLSARGEALSLNEVLKVVGLDSPIDGTGAVEGEMSVTLGDPSTLNALAEVRVVESRVRSTAGAPAGSVDRARRLARLFQAAGTGTVSLQGKTVTFTAPRIQSGSTTVGLKLTKVLADPHTSLTVTADTTELGETSALLESILERQSKDLALPWNSARLDGHGAIDGEFQFVKGGPVRGTLTFAIHDFSYESIGADAVYGTAAADGHAFTFTVTRAEKQGGALTLEGEIPEAHAGESTITGQLTSWPVDDILARMDMPGRPGARATGPLVYRFGTEGTKGDTTLALSDAHAGDVALGTGVFEASLRGQVLQMTRIALKGPSAELEASGSYDLSSTRWTGSMRGLNIDASIASPWLKGLAVEGHAEVEMKVDTPDLEPQWEAHLRPAPDFRIAGRPASQLTLDATGGREQANFVGTFGELADFDGRVNLAAPHEGLGRIAVHALPIASLVGLYRPDIAAEIGGEVGGEIVWTGPLDDMNQLTAHATIEPLRLGVGTESFSASGPARLSLEHSMIRFDELTMVSGGSSVAISGVYPVEATGAIAMAIEGELDLGALAAFVPSLTASGTVRGNLKLAGSRDHPGLSGTLDVDNGRLRLVDFPLLADRIRLHARVDSAGLTTESLSALVGGGEFLGAGHVDLDGLMPTGFKLSGTVTNARLSFPEGWRAQYSGRLAFEQEKGGVPALTGDLEIVRGEWDRDFSLDRFTFGGKVRQPAIPLPPTASSLLRSTMDIKLNADDNIWCHNDLADLEGSARVILGGTIGKPELTGRFEGFEGGEMRFRDVRYVLDKATVDFPPGPRFNPEFDVIAETHVGDYDVRAHFSGNFDHLDYELSSSPPLSEKQVLALLLTGTALPEEEVASTGHVATPATVVSGQISSMVGGRLEHWLSLSEVRIESVPSTTGATTDPTTRVTLGKRLSPRVFVKTAIALNSAEQPLYSVEYAITRKLRVTLERGELSALGGDLRYSTRLNSPFLKGKGATGAAPPQVPASESAGKKKRKIAHVWFQGDPQADSADLLKAVKLASGGDFSRREMVDGADRLKRRYVRASYLEASVRPSAKPAGEGLVDIVYEIERGPKITVTLVGGGSYARKIRKALKSLWLESSMSGDLAEQGEEEIRSLLQADGYYACYVKTRMVDHGDSRELIFEVDPGEKVVVRDVRIEGTSGLAQNEVREQVLTGNPTLFSKDTLKPDVLAADVSAIVNLYLSKGYLQAQARSSVSLAADGKSADVLITVIEGPRSHLRKVTIVGASAISEQRIAGRIACHSDQPFLPPSVLTDVQSIQSLYDSEGYPDARVEEEITQEGNEIDLTYRISEGTHKTVQEVVLSGNEITKDNVVMREVIWKPGDPISAAKMKETRAKLMKTGLYSDVKITYEESPSGGSGQILRIHVDEAKSLILSLGAGYDNETGARGSVELANINLFGRGKYAGVSALYGSKISHLQFTYREPKLFDSLWAASLTTFYDQRVRSSFSEKQVAFSTLFSRKTQGPISHYLSYGIGRSEVYDLKIDVEQFQVENPKLDPTAPIRLASAAYAIVRDARDDPINTTKGTYASADLRGFSKYLGSQATFLKLFTQASYYHPAPFGFQWGTSLRVGLAWRGQSEPIPLQERYFAGGSSTVRGFGQDDLGFVKVSHEFSPPTGTNGNGGIVCPEGDTRVDTNGDGTNDTCKSTLDEGTLEHDTLRPFGGESVLIFNNELRHTIYKSFSGLVFVDMGNTYPRATDVFSGHLRYTAGLGLRVDSPVGPLRIEYGRKLNKEPGESSGEWIFSIGQTF